MSAATEAPGPGPGPVMVAVARRPGSGREGRRQSAIQRAQSAESTSFGKGALKKARSRHGLLKADAALVEADEEADGPHDALGHTMLRATRPPGPPASPQVNVTRL